MLITAVCIVTVGSLAALLYNCKHKNRDGGKAVSPTIIHKMNEAIRDELVMLSRNSRGNDRGVQGVRLLLYNNPTFLLQISKHVFIL